jgi:hypothetical protein
MTSPRSRSKPCDLQRRLTFKDREKKRIGNDLFVFGRRFYGRNIRRKQGLAQSVQTSNDLLPCSVVWESAISHKSAIGLGDDGP